MSTTTLSQQAALDARGNVLVVAGAGTGKTHTLVERCCSLLLAGDCSLDEILMVTFTEAASAEMRRRIRGRLAEKAEASDDARQNRHLAEQIALLDTAYISTLHSFCLRLVREHFHEDGLQLDPEFVVLGAEQLHQMRNNTLDALLETHYGGKSEEAIAFQKLVAEQAGGNEGRVRELIWNLHRYSRSLADPAVWFEKQLAAFADPKPTQWRQWLQSGFNEWRNHWLPELEAHSGTSNVADCAKALCTNKSNWSIAEIGEALAKIQQAYESKWLRGTVGTVRDQIKDFFSDAAFLASLLPKADGEDPLAEDWEWSRGHMQTLLLLAREFGERFDDAKREAGGVDFADLEQFALRLLWDSRAGRPTPLAAEWQARLKFVFVDEYQDINEAQDTILRALSRDGLRANRFLVGDVKQSIYRFRLADPKIFQGYKKQWSESSGGRTIPLSDNFRSREALLDFVNSFFGPLMREEIGGVNYDSDAMLKFGAPDQRSALSRRKDPAPQVEIHLRVKTKDDAVGGHSENGLTGDYADLGDTEKEARLVALQLKKLRNEKLKIWDNEKNSFRAVEWRDMVVLLRSPRSKAEIYAREFNRAGVPLHVKRESFYSATEISDLLSLLQLLDNPMQDLPLLAVLRSPIVGLSVDELAIIRAGQRDDRFWTALLSFGLKPVRLAGAAGEIATAALPKVGSFLKDFDIWRRHAKQGALSGCVRRILDATHYESLILAQERGEERLANLNRLLRLMRQFDPYQRQGLMRFLRFVDSQRDAEAEEEPAAPDVADAVRLLSIHLSKGLEFPVVVVADLSKAFNVSDLHADILLDPEFGLCPRITPEGVNSHYPSLPYWLARRRHKKELLGEELRLLYVAMTRARDRLILTGSIGAKQFENRWQQDRELSTTTLLQARSYADWIALWFAKNCAAEAGGARSGETALCRWKVHDDSSLDESEKKTESADAGHAVKLNKEETDGLRRRLSVEYAFATATEEPAKTSVSALRRRATEHFDEEETVDFFRRRAPQTQRLSSASNLTNSAAEVGTVYHRFLERVSFKCVRSVRELRDEATRMVSGGVLSALEMELLDFDSLLTFWRSDFGGAVLANERHVQRELAFTARFSPAELEEISPRSQEKIPGCATRMHGEFVIVQGVADLAVILPKEIWLLDFKTDKASAKDLPGKVELYRPQLLLYARALQRIYDRPVTDSRLHFLSLGRTVALAGKTLRER